MANPVFTDITANTWTKIATNVTSGKIRIVTRSASYLSTYRITGDGPPLDKSDGFQIFTKEDFEDILSSFAIDVYLYCPEKAGRVRVDL